MQNKLNRLEHGKGQGGHDREASKYFPIAPSFREIITRRSHGRGLVPGLSFGWFGLGLQWIWSPEQNPYTKKEQMKNIYVHQT